MDNMYGSSLASVWKYSSLIGFFSLMAVPFVFNGTTTLSHILEGAGCLVISAFSYWLLRKSDLWLSGRELACAIALLICMTYTMWITFTLPIGIFRLIPFWVAANAFGAALSLIVRRFTGEWPAR